MKAGQNNVQFKIYSGKIWNGKIENSLEAGIVLKKDTESFYRVKFFCFPRTSYFLKKNREGAGYTLYSSCKSLGKGEYSFSNPCGRGHFRSDCPTFLQITMQALNFRTYMNTYEAA